MITLRVSKKGFTMMEVMLAVAIAALTLCGILLTYATCFNLIKTSKNVSIAASAARGLMDEIRNTPFHSIRDYNNITFDVDNMPQNKGVVYVDETNPELLKVTISVSWKQGNKVIGEDTNFNGLVDAGESTDAILDSPVELVTLISNREI
ncbi:MAG: prepilin-type N-terminal cleavage/methylation domain-containing protein [Candidatus Omnitrophota bacterium]|jgi:prepilin-type N-terminal cleavage/methylation domain-containing protein